MLKIIMFSWNIVLVILSLSLGVDARGKKGQRTPIKPGTSVCLPMKNSTTTAKLKCKSRRDVIYTMDIRSYPSGQCDDLGSCHGLQPRVLTSSLGCYWDRGCKINYSSRSPIVQTEDIDCIGGNPSLLTVQYSCIGKKKLAFLDKDTNGRKPADFGMIVSHKDYPWHYDPGLDIISTLNLIPKSGKITKLFLTVQTFDIDHPRDIARVETGDKGTWVNITKTGNLFIRASETKIEFMVNRASPAGHGFLLCYYWAEKCEDLAGVNICKKVERMRKKKKNPCRKRSK